MTSFNCPKCGAPREPSANSILRHEEICPWRVPGIRVYYAHEDITDQVFDSKIIEGTAVRVEKDPARLLDAGGSEP